MSKIKVNWQNHIFEVHDHGANWADVAGIYIFAGINHLKRWVPLYIGKAESFRNRLPSHERWAEAKKLGATHVHAMALSRDADRSSIEEQLIKLFKPKLNTLMK
jgi:excinuclease UvrABC nuclease subunit